jgi:mono/diheme cytochrome c family protein
MKGVCAKIATFLLGLSAAALFAFLIPVLNSALAQDAALSSGKDVYTKKCASCHGKQGEGVAKIAAMLKTKIGDFRGVPVTADTLLAWKKIAAEGKGKMPGQAKSKLTGAQIDSALAHVVTLTKSAPAAKTKAEGATTEEKK